MTSPVDWLIVGAGFTGAVVAERLANAGLRVLVIDQREHVAGNAYEFMDHRGILCHAHGPHIFHTNSARIVDYLSRFTAWRPYEHRVLGSVGGQFIPLPFNFGSIDVLFPTQAKQLKQLLTQAYGSGAEVPIMNLLQSPSSEVRGLATTIYELVFVGYTTKQWGVEPRSLGASVMARVPVRMSYDDRYFTDVFQQMPANGYTTMFDRMLKHDNINLRLSTAYRDIRKQYSSVPTVYTGGVDEFFSFELGPLPYRSLRFEFETIEVDRFQPTAQVNYPGSEPFTRITEMKYLTSQISPRTTIAREFPMEHVPGVTLPYYPIPQVENVILHKKYESHAAVAAPHVVFAGRLGEYRYYNMDQAIGAALKLADRLLS